MTTRLISLPSGRKVALAELGDGAPLLYLHDFMDIHGATTDWSDFHHRLASRHRLIAPAHAGCAGSDEDEETTEIGDVVFHVLELLDVLNLDSVAVLGVGIGGWIAAELAVRCRRIVDRLVLIGATGLFLPGQPIADIFFESQPLNGEYTDAFRRLLFGAGDSDLALAWIPRGRLAIERELLRYQMFRFAHRVGFKPPFLHDRRLTQRLQHYRGPALVMCGASDGLVPISHAAAYAAGFPNARLRQFADTGHSVHLEGGEQAASEILEFLA